MSMILALFAVMMLSLLLAPCLRAAESAPPPAAAQTVSFPGGRPETVPQPPPVPVRSMSKEDIRKALERIEKSTPPQPQMGAMCYSPAMPPSTVDYLCPFCGTKTHYADRAVARRVVWDVEACRRLADGIRKSTGADVTVDESGFCSKCASKTAADATPDLAVVVKFKDGSSKRTSPATPEDLRVLLAFFSGELSSKTSNDGRSPLKGALSRLRELLGEEACK